MNQNVNELVQLQLSYQQADLSFTTPYGPPSEDAYILQVPEDCVGLVIGTSGETIKILCDKTGAKKIQVAVGRCPGTDLRNVFIEGDI